MWIRSQYTSELAVIAAWVAVLIPWNLSRFSRNVGDFFSEVGLGAFPHTGTESVSMFAVQFPLFGLQFREETVVADGIGLEVGDDLATEYAGIQLAEGIYLTTPLTSMSFYEGTLWLASLLWTVAALAFVLALALSFALYFRTEETVARLPVSEVRLMGSLLGLAAVGLAGSSSLYFLERDTMGTPIPVGVLVVGALSVVLLLTEEMPESESA